MNSDQLEFKIHFLNYTIYISSVAWQHKVSACHIVQHLLQNISIITDSLTVLYLD